VSIRHLVRPEALRGKKLDGHAVIEASAGTGKTFTLEHIVVELLLGGATIDQILVVTFTEKATTELRLRVRAKLEELVAQGGTSEDPGVEHLKIDDAARAHLARALHGYDGATIATIHAFCQRVLRENAFASGRLFEEQQVDGRDAFARVFRDVLRKDIAADPVRSAWLEVALGEGLSVTGLEDLLYRCLTARCELLPPFDEGAGRGLEQALTELDTSPLRAANVSIVLQRWGVHSRTGPSLARHLAAFAAAVDKARVSSPSCPAYVAAAKRLELAYLSEKLPSRSFDGSPLGRACAQVFALARSTPSINAAVVHVMLAPVREELARRKRETGQYDFDDMLLLVDAALAGPRGEELRSAMRRRWTYALIDEFQDTDETQWSIFRRAFFEPRGQKAQLFLVGDPKQSIYRFRGADVDTYLRARSELLEAGATPVALARNYRATKDLVDSTNALLEQGAKPAFFTGSVHYEAVACGRPERALTDGEGRPVTPLHAFRFEGRIDLPLLGGRIAAEILRITDRARPWKLDGRALMMSDIFVLTRKNDEARTVGAALRAAGVPFAYFKEDGLFQTDEAIEIRDLLAAVDDPGDRSRRAGAWLTRFFELPLAEVDRARELPPSHPFLTRLATWKALGEAREFDRLFQAILEGSGLVRREIFFGDGERELTNYLHIFEILLEHTRQARVTLTDLVHLVSGLIDKTRMPVDIEGNLQRLESERRAVQVMTIHKAKGLEAPVVFIAGGFSPGGTDLPRIFHEGDRRCGWVGTTPGDVKARASEEEREDDQRLMYVALTRAMGRLYLPSAVPDSDPLKSRRPYDFVNRRVNALADEKHPLLTVETMSEAANGVKPAPANDTVPPPAAPPVDLFMPDDARDYATLRAAHAGAVATSYTRMRSGRSRARSLSAVPEMMQERGERRDAKAMEEAEGDLGDVPLRSAKASGVFIHEILERIPLESFGAGELEAWRRLPEVASLFEEAIALHRVDAAQRAHAETLVWRAYSSRIGLPNGGRLEGLARASTIVREMDFVFSLPSGRVFARGSLDIAFEHDGLLYFADWKTDSRPSYDAGALASHVESHYGEQVKLYALAILKLADLQDRAGYEARFGGLLYCFLRGMDGEGAGVWSARPSWEEVVAWGEWLQKTEATMTGRSA
jgi:exodeoxyribonuclease V beta subunit